MSSQPSAKGGNVEPLLILGTRTLAVEIADVASEIPGVRVAGFVENLEPERCKESLDGLPIFWVDDLPRFIHDHWAVCGLATTQRSRYTDQVAALGMRFATLVHPSARISRTSSLGEGTILSVGVVVGAQTHLGKHVFVNRGALIGHHSEIANYVTVHPGANIAGACYIGESTYIGIGSIIIDHVKIGAHSVVGAGSVVIEDVPDHVLVVGVPAKIVKKNIPGK